MSFPQYPKKFNQEVIITPQQHFEAEKEQYQDFHCPKSIILCFEAYGMNHYRELESAESRPFWTGEMIYFNAIKKDIALVGNFGIGGPAASHMLEILIAAGVKEFIIVGHAGGLQKSNPVGSIVLGDKAIRDEGVSYHYLEPDKYVYPSPTLSERIRKRLEADNIEYYTGSSWTIDNMYRETKDEIKYYADEGVATVEMELASLFAVGQFRKANIASLLVISDYVSFEKWEEHLNAQSTQDALFKSIEVAKRVLQQ